MEHINFEDIELRKEYSLYRFKELTFPKYETIYNAPVSNKQPEKTIIYIETKQKKTVTSNDSLF